MTGTVSISAQTSRELANEVEKASSLSNDQITLIGTCNELSIRLENLSKQLNEIIVRTRQTFIAVP